MKPPGARICCSASLHQKVVQCFVFLNVVQGWGGVGGAGQLPEPLEDMVLGQELFQVLGVAPLTPWVEEAKTACSWCLEQGVVPPKADLWLSLTQRRR